jgi:hypothetical protein
MTDRVDFWVRVAAPVVTFLAVLAALFREWFQARVFPPVLVLTLVDPRGTRITPEFSHIVVDGQQHPTASRWYHMRVRNDRRMSPATDTQVVLREVGIPNAAGSMFGNQRVTFHCSRDMKRCFDRDVSSGDHSNATCATCISDPVCKKERLQFSD